MIRAINTGGADGGRGGGSGGGSRQTSANAPP